MGQCNDLYVESADNSTISDSTYCLNPGFISIYHPVLVTPHDNYIIPKKLLTHLERNIASFYFESEHHS